MSEPAVFEVLRFTGAPASGDVALLELEGVYSEHAPRGRERARLLLESAEESLEIRPAATARLPEGVWRGSYAVPLALVGGAVYSLAIGRELLLDLPAPDVTATAGEPASHHVRLARETNELRRRLDEAEEARNAAEAAAEAARAGEATEAAARAELEAAREGDATAVAEATAARERAEAALAEATTGHQEREATARTEADQQLASAREQAAQQLTTAGEEADRRLKQQEAEAERRVEEAIAAERARAAVTSHELRSAKAELEALRRELGVLRNANRRPGHNGGGDGDGDAGGGEISARRVTPPAGGGHKRDAERDAEREPEPVTTIARPSGDGDETVRLLSARPPRPRHRPEDETEPETLPPGAAATGARSMEPAGAHTSSARALAFAALAVGMLAALLVIVLRVGLF